MASQQTPSECKPYIKEGNAALHHYGLWAGFRYYPERERDGVELLTVRNSTLIIIPFEPPVAGRWTLDLKWTIRRVPAGDPILWRSSFGLTVTGVPFVPKGESACLVRYDFDNDHPGPTLGAIGAHLNILQPAPLDDSIHFPVLAEPNRAWRAREVLDVFLSDQFLSELRDRLGE